MGNEVGKVTETDRGAMRREELSKLLLAAGDDGCSANEMADALGLSRRLVRWYLWDSPRPLAIKAAVRFCARVRYFHPDFAEAAKQYADRCNSLEVKTFYLSAETEQRILAECVDGPTTRQIAEAVGIARRTAREAIAKMRREGKVKTALWPVGRGGVEMRVFLPHQSIPNRQKNKRIWPTKPYKAKKKEAKEIKLKPSTKKPDDGKQRWRDLEPKITSKTKVTICPVGLDHRHTVKPEEVTPCFSAMTYGQYLPEKTWSEKVYA